MNHTTRRDQFAKVRTSYLMALIACLITASLAGVLNSFVDLVNIVMIFLLAVFLVSVHFGRGPGIFATFVSVALFDFFFVPPKLTFAVSDVQYFLTFIVMAAVALITGQMAARLRLQAEQAELKEARTQQLYELARALSGALKQSQVDEIGAAFLHESTGVMGVLLLPDANGNLEPVKPSKVWYESHIATAVFQQPAHLQFTQSDNVFYFPLLGATRVHGVLVVELSSDKLPMEDAFRELLLAVASMLAVAIERLHYVEIAKSAEMEYTSERLRSSILSALSHDLRTPLTVLVGMVDSLQISKPPLDRRQKELTESLHHQAMRLNHLVSNLLDMARLHTGKVSMQKSWQPLEEVIGASIQLLGDALKRHKLSINLPADLPLLEFDEILIERVFCNLLENAAKYSPEDTSIHIKAEVTGDSVCISVEDQGQGIPADKMDDIFRIFVRADNSHSTATGTGIGLAICRAVVEAHQGRIWASNLSDSGACFSFTLPLGVPPVIPEEMLEIAP